MPIQVLITQTSQSKRVVIAGGSGFLGVSLASHLAAANWQVAILSRNRPRPAGPWEHVAWDGRSPGKWSECLDGADGLVNLVGRTVDCVKTPDHCDEILRSRVEATRVLGAACRTIAAAPPVWVQMSTAHIYGDPPTVWCDEDSPAGYGLAPAVGLAWESEFAQSLLSQQRGVVLRTNFVIGRNRGAGGGALSKLVPRARCGLGGSVGSGRQGMSWIHEQDMNRLFERGLTDSSMVRIYVASSPNPVSNSEFMRSLRQEVPWLKVPLALPAFRWMVRIGAPLLLRTDPEIALCGWYVISRRLEQGGFTFSYPRLPEALAVCFIQPTRDAEPGPGAVSRQQPAEGRVHWLRVVKRPIPARKRCRASAPRCIPSCARNRRMDYRSEPRCGQRG
ncbi:MAG: epimerase [Planctomycetota bacterium]